VNYQRHYDALIQKALNRSKPEGYTEKHHIVPRSMGGSDDPTNLVILTAREHCVAHILLAKIHGGTMWYAAYIMINRFTIKSSRIYASIREQVSKDMSDKMMGNSYAKGHKHSEETIKKLKKSRAGRTPTLGKFHSEETRKNMSLSRKGFGNSNYKGEIQATNVATNKVLIFKDLAEALKYGFKSSGISSSITGNQKVYKGYTFKRPVQILENAVQYLNQHSNEEQ
jgi:hypothetical protein